MAKPTQFYAHAWLLIAQGGWWKPNEIMGGMPDELRGKDGHARLWYMVRSGYLVRRELAPEARKKAPRRGCRERVEYAVTPECLVPQGICAGAISEALTGRRA